MSAAILVIEFRLGNGSSTYVLTKRSRSVDDQCLQPRQALENVVLFSLGA